MYNEMSIEKQISENVTYYSIIVYIIPGFYSYSSTTRKFYIVNNWNPQAYVYLSTFASGQAGNYGLGKKKKTFNQVIPPF